MSTNYAELKNRLDVIGTEINGVPSVKTVTEVNASVEYNNAFRNHMRTGIPENSLRKGADGSGGYLVPDSFEKSLIQGLKENNVLRNLATILPTKNDIAIPVQTSGAAAEWIEECGHFEGTDISFGQIEINAHKLGLSVIVSEELLEDSAFDLEKYLVSEFSSAIGDAEENAFLTGNGIGKPTGLISQVTTDVASEKTGELHVEDMLNLVHSLKEPYRDAEKAVFIMSEDALCKLRKEKIADGRYLWNPDFKNDGFETLFGYRVYTSKHMSGVENGNIPVLFGDFSYFWIGERGKRTVKRLTERYAEKGQVAFMTSERIDAKLVLSEAVKGIRIS